ncbi:DUF885 domain-containing protein [Phycicoccus endophyticus]|uniref:DUF885 domain-containing protein n=1 Tax=Phycicoccus endophyticus TaxID=1690220 RepID=A0A7G9R300_9MICO|nr:DUF885 domain-containing protein [Phycicoccus endophyticus]NHI20267.1 DUF885 domain-containing protein [Phycicoccus endophyticus]QNN49975.1 DUF885 domain-containing protein [Phycicoccus endophyticus]GGL29142.1 hypothetical protein GCM10012283_09300 [Phycicoccus endophyticus]
MSEPTLPRRPTAVDAVADAHFDAAVALSPIEATYLGVPGHDHELDDLSPAGYAAHADLARETLARLDAATPVDAVDEVTVAAMRERLGLQLETHEAGYDRMELNVIASPLQACRDVVDLMPTDTEQDWATIAARLGQVPRALGQYLGTLRESAERGLVTPRRQVEACIRQCADLTAPDGYFATFLADARVDGAPLEGPLAAQLQRAVEGAAAAYEQAGTELADRLLERAPREDAAGRERYQLASRAFLGARVDLEETYAWGQEELARVAAEMAATAQRIVPGGTLAEAVERLDGDEAYRLHGTEALRAWMQVRADEAIADLAGTHFDIPDPVRTIECRIAPTQTGGIYYTGPSDDFTRPGRMWWSVPKGVTEFGTWKELTTVYHEGVPGHHLQVAQTVHRRELLNRWRRMMCWVSGHGEGWALYAEQLMAELGYLEDPGTYLGMLDAQSLRAARVVIDIGVHCGFEAPAEVGGGAWTYDKAWAFLTAHASNDEATLRFELDRYLGWPGQAPSYKVGQRLWLQLREEVRSRDGDAFSLKDFHRRALDVGSVGLDVLRTAVLDGPTAT